jgi:hypothetical protein
MQRALAASWTLSPGQHDPLAQIENEKKDVLVHDNVALQGGKEVGITPSVATRKRLFILFGSGDQS